MVVYLVLPNSFAAAGACCNLFGCVLPPSFVSAYLFSRSPFGAVADSAGTPFHVGRAILSILERPSEYFQYLLQVTRQPGAAKMRSTACTAILALMDWNTYTVSSTGQQTCSPSPTEPDVSSTAQQQTREPSTSQPGVMFWTDGKAKTMPVYYRAMAMVTLLFFVSWIWIIAFGILATPFSKLIATLTVLAWLTLLLPTQVRRAHVILHRIRRLCACSGPSQWLHVVYALPACCPVRGRLRVVCSSRGLELQWVPCLLSTNQAEPVDVYNTHYQHLTFVLTYQHARVSPNCRPCASSLSCGRASWPTPLWRCGADISALQCAMSRCWTLTSTTCLLTTRMVPSPSASCWR